MPEILGITQERIEELYNKMRADLEKKFDRPLKMSDGLEYIRDADWSISEKIVVTFSLKTSVGS